jgi:hypothetical protein
MRDDFSSSVSRAMRSFEGTFRTHRQWQQAFYAFSGDQFRVCSFVSNIVDFDKKQEVSVNKVRAAASAFSLIVAAPSAAAIVNIDALTNSGLTAANAVSVNLGPGSYTVTPIIGAFTAFSRFATVSGCDSNGAKCVNGFEHSYFVTIGGNSIGYGGNNGLGTIGPQSTGGYYATALQAFTLDGTGTTFTLAAPQAVKFWIYDDFLTDNRGGVSLNVAAVPEPASWAMLITGFALTGAMLRRRRVAAVG